jgi:ABC-type sugar transport system ATPase subunit
MNPINNEYVLELSGISKYYPGVIALDDVKLNVKDSEILGLVGKNGAGKSTLVKVLMGLQTPDAGTIRIGENVYKHITSGKALEQGVGYVPQHLKMMDCLSVAENILSGDLPKNSLGLINWKAAYKQAEDRLEKLGLDIDVYQNVEGLKLAEKTMLAIAKALFGDAKIIILDEVTASLPHADIEQLFGFINSLKNDGVAFIYISHHLEEVFEICDRVTVLRDGRHIETCEVSDLDMVKLANLIIGEDLHEFTRESTCTEGSPVLEIEGFTRRGSYENVNLKIDKGCVVGLSGLQGCGSEDLIASLFGLERRGIGNVNICGDEYKAMNPSEAFENGVALLPQDRARFGMVGVRSVRENSTYAMIDKLTNKIGLVNEKLEKKIVGDYIDELGVKTPGQEQLIGTLSGGNQQKVVFAKLAASKPDLLILHEPTSGVDVRAKQDIFRIIDKLASDGVSVLIVSSEIRELIGICDRILVMYKGRIVEEFNRGDENLTPENILLAIEGGTQND